MPSVTYMNQSAPFWDFIASLEQQGRDHPFFVSAVPQQGGEQSNRGPEHEGPHHPPPSPPPGFGPFGAWAQGWGENMFGGARDLPHRGPPPYEQREEGGEENGKAAEYDEKREKRVEDTEHAGNGEGSSHRRGDGRGDNSGSDNEGHGRGPGRRGHCGGRRGRCGPGGPGGFGGRGGHGHHHRGGPHAWGGRGRWGWGPWARGGHFGGAGAERGIDPSELAAHFWNQFVDKEGAEKTTGDQDHVPDADIFDTPAAYIVHLSLPGAQKSDINVSYSAEISELLITGVVHRPAECDEAFLKHLAVSERKVGVFERKIRLGTRATPAAVDVEGITAKLEEGVLRVEVPKLGEEDFVEVRKVDVL